MIHAVLLPSQEKQKLYSPIPQVNTTIVSLYQQPRNTSCRYATGTFITSVFCLLLMYNELIDLYSKMNSLYHYLGLIMGCFVIPLNYLAAFETWRTFSIGYNMIHVINSLQDEHTHAFMEVISRNQTRTIISFVSILATVTDGYCHSLKQT